MLGRFLLQTLSREDATEQIGSTASGDPLSMLLSSYPDLADLVRGKSVLDFGCGRGDQAAAIAHRFSAAVTGLDTNKRTLDIAAANHGSVVNFIDTLPPGRTWDIVISLNAMEHYNDPGGAIAAMKQAVAPGGLILISFGPPWWAPYGSHMHFFCRVPWLQLWFSERTIMSVRAKYRNDGAQRFEDVESGLNRMSLSKYERLVSQSGLSLVRLNYTGAKGMHWISRIPVLRELGTVHVTSVLRREAQ